LIVKRLQIQLANSNGIHVDDITLNETLQTIAQQNNMTLSEFHDRLTQDGFDFELFRENMRDEITLRELRQRQVDNRITVTEQEINDQINNQSTTAGVGVEYHLAHLLIAVPEAASPEDIHLSRIKAENILDQLRSGADFSKMAIEQSDGQQALNGGDLGWRLTSEVPSLFSDAVKLLSVNDTSDLIRSPSGFHIIKLLDKRLGKPHSITQTKARHILIIPDALNDDSDALQELSDLKRKIEKGDDFNQLAQKFSNDKGTASHGGDLGWVKPGMMVGEFEQAMNLLNIGEISEPIKSRFGWHLIQVLDRQEVDDTTTFNRNQIRQQLFQRKVEDAYEIWLQRLRSDAYVEIRLNKS
jgi:peptidyl-prolyl cis-trans isomerase SurA